MCDTLTTDEMFNFSDAESHQFIKGLIDVENKGLRNVKAEKEYCNIKSEKEYWEKLEATYNKMPEEAVNLCEVDENYREAYERFREIAYLYESLNGLLNDKYLDEFNHYKKLSKKYLDKLKARAKAIRENAVNLHIVYLLRTNYLKMKKGERKCI